ncbi:MAG: hypothetical protein CMI32_07620 [Opitutales bacterium]|nr:hypothetical protein [Opitutales bacterium]
MELGAVRLAVVERRVEGVTNREVADAPGLRDTFTLGDVRLYVLRELGFDGVERRVLGALNVDVSVRLLLALGLADAVALRPALADRVLLGEAAIFPLLREPL